MLVHQMVASLTFGDAIGNEALRIQSVLRSHGVESEIFAESTDSAMSGRARELSEYPSVSSPDNVLLLHFSIGSKSASLARELPDRLLLRYHNITPAHWFADFAPKVARQCVRGRQELATFAERTALALGVSEYNRSELEELGFQPTGVLPLLSDPERLAASPSPVVEALFDDDLTNFLFVGPVIPNKRLEDVMKVVKYYQRFIDRKCRLIFVGECRDFERYYESLVGFADELDLKNVEFPGRVSTEELVAYYRVADVFLSMSEHEGFCAPLLEAYEMGVPVIAYDTGAVSETLGGGGILLHEKNIDEIAELAHLLVTDPELRDRVLSAQDRVLDERIARDDGEQLMRFVERVSGT